MKSVIAVLFVLIICAILFFVVPSHGLQLRQQQIAMLEKRVTLLAETVVPLKFSITERSDTHITVEIHLYDLSGTQVASTVQTIKGQQLAVDFQVVPLTSDENGVNVAFPVRIFTEKTAAVHGISLTDLYTAPDGFPTIFNNGPFSAPEERAELIRLFGNVRDGKMPDTSFGNALHEVPHLATFRTGTVYAVHAHPCKGGLEIR